jgi:outer membrane protein
MHKYLKLLKFYSLILIAFIPLTKVKSSEYFFENSSKIILKGFFNVDFSDGNLTNFAPPTLNLSNLSSLIKMGVGLNFSGLIFLNNYIAIGATAGLNYFKSNKSTLNIISQNYNINNLGTNSSDSTTNTTNSTITYGAIYQVPLGLIAQLHITPFGAIRPYIGLGYSYNILLTDSTLFTLSNKFGVIAQVGVDLLMENGAIYSIQLEKSFLKSTINYDASIGGATSNININPLSLSLGVGFQF